MFCKKCGEKIEKDSKFCTHCGNNILEAKESKTTIETVEKNITKENGLNNPKGLSGWLSLVGLGLIITPVLLLWSIYNSISVYDSADYINELIPGLVGLISFEIIGNIIFVGVAIYLLRLFFNKKTKFPQYYIYFLIGNLVFVGLDYFILSSLSADGYEAQQMITDSLSQGWTDMTRALISVVIWVSYMKKSKRVKVTFIEN